MASNVSVIRCADYDLEAVARALTTAVDSAGGFVVAGKTVLLKPNMLTAAGPEGAVTSRPEFLRAAIRLVRERGASRILVGDSPAVQSGDSVGQKSGLRPVALDEGAEWVDFSDSVEVAVPDGRLVRRFAIAKTVADADCVISLCRLKTHSFMYFTGAVKNLFGSIPGLQKSAFHLRFPGKREFGAMLADLMLAVKPSYALMDAIVGMEGPGPRNGSPRPIGVVLAGANPCAVDWVACSIVGYNPLDIPYLQAAAGDPVYGFDPGSIVHTGVQPEEVRVHDFRLVPIVHHDTPRSKGPAGRLFRNLTVPRPFFLRDRCVLCGACVKICPGSALTVESDHRSRKYIAVDYQKCVRCYCCHEVCPEDAIALRRRPW